jgi:hypothetical protein
MKNAAKKLKFTFALISCLRSGFASSLKREKINQVVHDYF